LKVGTLTVNNLGRYFHPKSLFFGVMEVDEFCKEEDDCCSPEHYGILIRLRIMVKNEGDTPTASP